MMTTSDGTDVQPSRPSTHNRLNIQEPTSVNEMPDTTTAGAVHPSGKSTTAHTSRGSIWKKKWAHVAVLALASACAAAMGVEHTKRILQETVTQTLATTQACVSNPVCCQVQDEAIGHLPESSVRNNGSLVRYRSDLAECMVARQTILEEQEKALSECQRHWDPCHQDLRDSFKVIGWQAIPSMSAPQTLPDCLTKLERCNHMLQQSSEIKEGWAVLNKASDLREPQV